MCDECTTYCQRCQKWHPRAVACDVSLEGERPRALDPSPQQFTEAAALDWLDKRLSEGRGALTFCATEGDGCPGLFIDGRPKAIGTGDSIVEAIWDAERNWKGWDGAGEAVEYVQICSCATGAFDSRKLNPSSPIHGKPPETILTVGDTASPPLDRDQIFAEGAARGLTRAEVIAIHDYPKVHEFWQKYALGTKARPSCLVCGRDDYAWPPAIQHVELPGIVVCHKCRDAASGEPRASVSLPSLDEFPDVKPATALPWAMYDGWGPHTDGLMRALRIGGAHPNGGIRASEFGADVAGQREDFEYIVTACNAYPRLREALRGLG